jgi:hypothetical protein
LLLRMEASYEARVDDTGCDFSSFQRGL